MDAIEIGWAVATTTTGGLFTAFGVAPRTRFGWGCFAISFVPIVIMTIICAPELPSMVSRIALSATVGAIFGALFLIGTVEFLHTKAQAQPTENKGEIQLPDTKTPTPPPGTSGNFNFGQIGGTTNQTYINQALPDLTLTPQVKEELLTKIPKDKIIHIELVGPKLSDLETGNKIKDFLIANGYKVDFTSTMIAAPQPVGKLVWNPDASVLTIAPSLK